MRERRFADPGDVLDQQVTTRKQAGDTLPKLLCLADDDAVERGDDGAD
jgi:hypothetical protein